MAELSEHVEEKLKWANSLTPILDGPSEEWIAGYIYALVEIEEKLADRTAR